jgi:hypothetical protein
MFQFLIRQILSLCLAICIACIPSKRDGSLSLVIIEDELRINHIQERVIEPCLYNCIDIKLKLVNTTDNNILLFNFNRNIEHGEFSEIFFCDSSFLSADRLIYISNELGEIMRPSGAIPDSVHGRPISDLKRQIEMEETWFINSKQIVKKGETFEFHENVNLRDFQLFEKGDYTLKILYFQHDVLRKLTQSELESELRKHDAYLFKGCLWSNSVKLIVE